MKAFIAILVLVILGAGAWFLWQKDNAPADTMQENESMDKDMSADEMGTSDDTRMDVNVDVSAGTDTGMEFPTTDDAHTSTFHIVGRNFSFDTDEIRVKEGDTVVINFSSADGFHDWAIDEFGGVKTARVNTGQSTSITFVADKAGTYEYYCSVGNHRQMGMVGKLIVE